MLVIAGVFAYIISGRTLGAYFLNLIPITLVAVGLGFVLHELAHKFVAVRYGFFAEYRMWVEGLVLAIITASFGFLFAAPGAVYIHGDHISREENGKISLAGPLTNIALAVIFFLLKPSLSFSPFLSAIISLGFLINSFLALFNLIPFSIFDGAKIFRWNPLIWLITAGFAFLLVAYSYIGSLIV